ncbi:MAG TPA: hypothetical protein PK808_05330 [Polymorphobacter sp.]|nr:hypothetical protein [Polymorphobacter sp.]
MSLSSIFRAGLVAPLIMLSVSALAQTAAQVADAPTLPGVGTAPAAPTAPPMTPNTDLLGTSCGEFVSMLAVANPGNNPTSDRQSQATRAQRDVFMLVVWTHGYVTGKSGADLSKVALTKDWITKNTAALAKVCKANPNLSTYQAAGKL